MDLIVGEKKKRIRGKRNKNKKKGNPKKILKRKLAASATVTTPTKKKSVKQQSNNNTSVDSTKDPPDKFIQSNSSDSSKDNISNNNNESIKKEVKKEEKLEKEDDDEEVIKIEEVIEKPLIVSYARSKLETKLTIESAILRTANGKCKKKEEPENIQDEVENSSMSTNENDNSWVEVPIRSKKTKKKISISKSNPSSAPVSPRTQLTQTKKAVRSRRSSSGPSLEHRRISIRSNQTKKETSESKELKNNRSKSSSSLTEMIPKETNHVSSNLVTRSPPIKRIKIVPRVCQRSPPKVDSPTVTAARVRSASCSPHRTSTTSPRRSHSASARSRKSPVRKSAPANESTQSPPGNKRVRIDKPNSTTTQQRRCRLYRTTNRQTQMHVLHTHEEEHEVANALSKEISSYVDYLKNIVRTHHLRLIDKIIQRVRCSVGSLWSSAVIRVYGSIATGLCIP